MNASIEDTEDVIVFWDFETSPSLTSIAAISTYEMVNNLRSAVAMYGPLKSIRMYWDYGSHPFPSTTLRIRSEFSASGVNLVDCPAEGRKGAAIKKMLVDMLFHAWDSPLPPTFVVITGDRDVAYALAMLRMKCFRVVLISPAGSHTDLTSQASVHLDWSRTILGINGVSNEDGLFQKESPDRTIPSAHAAAKSSNSSKLGQETFTFRSEVPTTLRDNPTPALKPSEFRSALRDSPAALKPSIFSSPYDHGLNVFGGPRFASPKSSFGLGDPLFPSANQKPPRSRSGSLTELLRPISLTNKGKNKASEPEDIELHPHPSSSRSRLWSSASIFGPFDDGDELPIPPSSVDAAAAVPERAVSSNSSGSRQSKFSFEQISKPTEVTTTQPVDPQPSNGEPTNEPRAAAGIQQQTETVPLPPLPPVVIPSTTPTQKPKAFQKISPRASGTPKPKPVQISKPLPPAWVPLIQTLRKHDGVLSKPTLAPTLLKYYPNAFGAAGSRTIKTYLKAATNAGIVSKCVRANGLSEIHLRPPYLT